MDRKHIPKSKRSYAMETLSHYWSFFVFYFVSLNKLFGRFDMFLLSCDVSTIWLVANYMQNIVQYIYTYPKYGFVVHSRDLFAYLQWTFKTIEHISGQITCSNMCSNVLTLYNMYFECAERNLLSRITMATYDFCVPLEYSQQQRVL